MTRILDCHIHAYPPGVAENPRAWSAAHREPWFADCVAPPGQPTLQAWADTDQLLRDMDRAGVEQVVMLGWYWENHDTCELQNRWFTECHRHHPDRIHAFAAANPAAGRRCLDDIRRCLDAGLRGIGELLPQVQGFSYRDENFARLAELASTARVPFNLHVTPALHRSKSPQPATPLADFLDLAAAFPANTFILAHWGGGIPFFEQNPRVRKKLHNVFYDTSASPLLYDREIFRHVCDLVGPRRILFGTDYPLLLYPRESRQPDFARMIADIRASGLTPEEFDRIMGRNLLDLLRLP